MNVGLIGAGWVGCARHLPAYAAAPGVEVVAIYDRNRERADAALHLAPGATATDDWDRFADLPIDAVSVCTSPWSHAELSVASLELGRHVLCEKPMALSVVDAKTMVTAATTAQRVLCVSHNFLFSRAMQTAERLLGPEPDLRHVAGLQLSSLRRRLPTWYPQLPGGLLVDESPHLLYTLHHLLGSLRLDHARASFDPATGHPLVVEALVAGDRGPGQITMTFDTPVSEWQVAIVAADRVVALDLFRDIAVHVPADGAHGGLDVLRTSARAIAGHAGGVLRSGTLHARHRLSWGHGELISRFVAACRGEAPSPVDPAVSTEIVALTTDLLDAIGVPR